MISFYIFYFPYSSANMIHTPNSIINKMKINIGKSKQCGRRKVRGNDLTRYRTVCSLNCLYQLLSWKSPTNWMITKSAGKLKACYRQNILILHPKFNFNPLWIIRYPSNRILQKVYVKFLWAVCECVCECVLPDKATRSALQMVWR